MTQSAVQILVQAMMMIIISIVVQSAALVGLFSGGKPPECVGTIKKWLSHELGSPLLSASTSGRGCLAKAFQRLCAFFYKFQAESASQMSQLYDFNWQKFPARFGLF